jgi:HlyD family secretion protein
VRYTVDALPNETFTGTVNKIRPNATMSSNVVTYIVEVDIDNPDRKLLPYMSANANFIVREEKDCLLVLDSAFDFIPDEKHVDPSAVGQLSQGPRRPKRPEGAEGMPGERPEPSAGEASFRPARLWKDNGNGKLVPVMVLRGESDGTRSIVKPMPGETLAVDTEFVSGVVVKMDKSGKPSAGGDSPFGMKRPERRQRGAGGVEAKPGQGPATGGRGPRM